MICHILLNQRYNLRKKDVLILKVNISLYNMSWSLKKKKSKSHSGHNEKAWSMKPKPPFAFQKSGWKQMVKCVVNKQVVLCIVTDAKSVSSRTTALVITGADEERGGDQEGSTQAQASRPFLIHFWSVWQMTLTQHDYDWEYGINKLLFIK